MRKLLFICNQLALDGTIQLGVIVIQDECLREVIIFTFTLSGDRWFRLCNQRQRGHIRAGGEPARWSPRP